MTNRQPKLQRSAPVSQGEELCVRDIIHYLAGVSRLSDEEKTGNVELSEGLRHLSRALRPYANCLVSELPDALKKAAPFASSTNLVPSRTESMLPRELDSLGHEDIEVILNDRKYTKGQIIELGVRRFGISRSRLQRLQKESAIEAVRAALDHERALDAISREARRRTGERARPKSRNLRKHRSLT